jgi:hypothetical protein
MKQGYELSNQLQELHVDVALFSETHLKFHERSFISNYHFYRPNRHHGRKGGTAVVVKRGVPNNHVGLPPLVSIEATGVCIPIGNCEVLLASVFIIPRRAWRDADITEFFKHFIRENNGLIRLEQFQNCSTTMPHSLISCGKW